MWERRRAKRADIKRALITLKAPLRKRAEQTIGSRGRIVDALTATECATSAG
jgi:hypothetical protein